MAHDPIHVACPDCGSMLEIDPATGKVLSHEKKGPVAAAGGEKPADLGDLVRRSQKSSGSAAEKFDQALREEKEHRETLEDKFRKAQDKTKSDPDSKPGSPLDDRWR